jgi:hypothetical protein
MSDRTIMRAGFYADVRREGRGTRLLAGPYRTHAEALTALEWARRRVLLHYSPWHAFDAFGTCRLTGSLPAGIFTPLDVFKTIRDRDGFVKETGK